MLFRLVPLGGLVTWLNAFLPVLPPTLERLERDDVLVPFVVEMLLPFGMVLKPPFNAGYTEDLITEAVPKLSLLFPCRNKEDGLLRILLDEVVNGLLMLGATPVDE